MEKDNLFVEVQKFRQKWLWILLIGLNVVFLVVQFFIPFKIENLEDRLTILPFMLLLFLFLVMRMETKIKKEGIYVKFTPFHFRNQFFDWNDISKFYIREYSPLGDFGGWGIRRDLSGDNKAYNVSGNKGLQLEFRNGKKLLIGTNEVERLTAVLSDLERVS